MTKKTISQGVVHKVPADLRKVLLSNQGIHNIWETLTPLARNEWICWITSPKKLETRIDHIRRIGENLRQGKRRPCCWAGCDHR